MTDQIDGEWYLKLLDLPAALSKERIVSVLKTIFKYNFNSENGLWNATYPKNRLKLFPAYFNTQQTAPWTGIEYAIASEMIDYGLWEEGVAVVKNIYERYVNAGRRWNHVECGDHYYRAMSSWAILLAATGFKVDLSAQKFMFLPPPPNQASVMHAPWFASTGYGKFAQTPTQFELTMISGKITLASLEIGVKLVKKKVTLGERILDITIQPSNHPNASIVQFFTPLELKEGQILKIE
jgi:hypothetical protein